MDRTERFYKINNLFNTHRVVKKEHVMEMLGISLSTFKRDIEYLRDRFYAPIIYNRELCGYCYEKTNDPRIEFPGLWLSQDECYELEKMVSYIEENSRNNDVNIRSILGRLKQSSC